jgi:hypothetical protein
MDRVLRCNRISIDIDGVNKRLKLIKTHFNMKHMCNVVLDFVTGKGFHVHGEFIKRTTEQNMNIRRLLSDCEQRLELDEFRLNSIGGDEFIDILFGEKTRYGVVTYEETLQDVTNPPFWGDGKTGWVKRRERDTTIKRNSKHPKNRKRVYKCDF